jgi:sugar O-acyltransferase (sialic acid O-acetyltransferase NeuD family)
VHLARNSRGRPVRRDELGTYVYGAGGHGRVVADILGDMGRDVCGFLDDSPTAPTEELGLVRPGVNLGGPTALSHIDQPVVLAIGDNLVRRQLAEQLDLDWISAVHPSALISSNARLGQDNVIVHGSIVQAHTRIGSHVLINTGASIDHHNDIGDFVHVAPHSTLCGGVTVGEGTFLGAATTVIPGVRIGRWCTVGAGSTVLSDLPDHCVAVGSPARVIRFDDRARGVAPTI